MTWEMKPPWDETSHQVRFTFSQISYRGRLTFSQIKTSVQVNLWPDGPLPQGKNLIEMLLNILKYIVFFIQKEEKFQKNLFLSDS